MVVTLLARAVTQSAGYLYPAYASYKALKARNARALVHWLEYWAVLGVYTLVEFFSDIFLFWFPFYYLIKALFVLWLALPMTKGSRYIYRSLLRPTLERHEQNIDEAFQQAQASAISTSSSFGRQAARAAFESLAQASLGVSGRSVEATEAVQVENSKTDNRRSSVLTQVFSTANRAFAMISSTAEVSDVQSQKAPMIQDEQQIRMQRSALQKMLEQLDQAESELARQRGRHAHGAGTSTPPVSRSPAPPLTAPNGSGSSSLQFRTRYHPRSERGHGDSGRLNAEPPAASERTESASSRRSLSGFEIDEEAVGNEDMSFSAGELDELMDAVKGPAKYR